MEKAGNEKEKKVTNILHMERIYNEPNETLN